MRSAEPRGTLARRLSWTLVLTSMIAAVTATGTALLFGDVLIRDNVERGVRDSARILGVEIDEAPQLLPLIEHEAHELGIDARVAVQRGAAVVAGDAELAVDLAGDECRVGSPRLPDELFCVRALAIDPSAMIVVAVPAERLRAHRVALGIAAGAVLALVLLGSVVVGTLLSRSVLRPLLRLQGAVIGIDASAPALVELPPHTRLEELDALRDALASLLDRLDAELQRARRFAASAAHELRTPLAKMRAELELAREVAHADPQLEQTFDHLERTSTRLATLTERLLLLATPREALSTASGSSVADLVEELVRVRPPEEAARLRLSVDEDDGLVRGDEVLLTAMIDNVVDNALKFSDGIVRIDVARDGDDVVVDVRDEGPGIPESLEGDLFTPFRRGDDARGRPGHGLGLALVSHIARAYGGSVELVPREGGAHLRIRLPARSHHAAPRPIADRRSGGA